MVLVPCEVSWDCVCFQQLLKDPKVSLAVLNPYIKRSIKVKSLKDITTKEKFSPLTANLMNLLAENGRLGNTQGVISAFSTIMSVHRGEVPCTVTTAFVSNSSCCCTGDMAGPS